MRKKANSHLLLGRLVMKDADGARADAWALQVNCGAEGFPELCEQDLSAGRCQSRVSHTLSYSCVVASFLSMVWSNSCNNCRAWMPSRKRASCMQSWCGVSLQGFALVQSPSCMALCCLDSALATGRCDPLSPAAALPSQCHGILGAVEGTFLRWPGERLQLRSGQRRHTAT